MRGLLFIFATLCLLLQSTPDARAWKFGSEDRIRYIQDVGARGAKGEALYLGYKMTVHNVMLGVHLRNDGYVLGIKGDDKHYYNLPPAKEVERLQRTGVLPNPLPPYRRDFADYAYGYLAWPILLLFVFGACMSVAGRARAESDEWARLKARS